MYFSQGKILQGYISYMGLRRSPLCISYTRYTLIYSYVSYVLIITLELIILLDIQDTHNIMLPQALIQYKITSLMNYDICRRAMEVSKIYTLSIFVLHEYYYSNLHSHGA